MRSEAVRRAALLLRAAPLAAALSLTTLPAFSQTPATTQSTSAAQSTGHPPATYDPAALKLTMSAADLAKSLGSSYISGSANWNVAETLTFDGCHVTDLTVQSRDNTDESPYIWRDTFDAGAMDPASVHSVKVAEHTEYGETTYEHFELVFTARIPASKPVHQDYAWGSGANIDRPASSKDFDGEGILSDRDLGALVPQVRAYFQSCAHPAAN